MNPDFSLNMDALNVCNEEDLQLVHAKLSVINKELLEVREILTKHLSRSSSCMNSCSDSEAILPNPSCQIANVTAKMSRCCCASLPESSTD